MLSQFFIVRLRPRSYVTCQVQYVSFSLCIVFFFLLLMLFSRLSLTGLPPTPSAMLLQAPPSICPCPSTAHVSFLFFFWLFCICSLSFPSVTCSSHAIPSHCAASPRFVDTTRSTLHQPPPGLFWPHRCLGHCTRLSTAHVSFFFFIVLPLLTPASLSLRAVSALSCCVCSLMLHPFSCCVCSLMLHPFSCHVHSPMPLLHPHPRCIIRGLI